MTMNTTTEKKTTESVEHELNELTNNYGKAKTAVSELMYAVVEFRDKIIESQIDKWETAEYSIKVRQRKPRKSFKLKEASALPKEELMRMSAADLLVQFTKETPQRATVYVRQSDLTKKVAEAIALAQKFGTATPKMS